MLEGEAGLQAGALAGLQAGDQVVGVAGGAGHAGEAEVEGVADSWFWDCFIISCRGFAAADDSFGSAGGMSRGGGRGRGR